MTFAQGARTDKDVGIGSTLRDLRSAYGLQLTPDPKIDPGYGFIVSERPGSLQSAIGFALDPRTMRVAQIKYATRATVGGYSNVYRVDC